MPRLSTCTIVLLATLALAACKSPEERAQEYYLSALELMEQGDVERALIELRNVFQNDGFHKEARQLYADTQFERGEENEAFRQYLRLIEQYPNTVDVRLRLAEMAIGQNDWDTAERHGQAAIALDADLPRSRAVDLSLRYRSAIIERDEAAQAEIVEAGLAEIDAQPDNLLIRRIAINHLLRTEQFAEAMVHVEHALGLRQDSYEFNGLKLQLLAQLGRNEEIGAHLKKMVDLFPEEVELKQTLIRWYFRNQDFEGAEAFLRAEAGDLTGDTDGHLDVVRLLQRVEGDAAAREELAALIAANEGTPNADFYRAYVASLDFDAGEVETALADLAAILETAEPSDQTRNISIARAQMLQAIGDRAASEEIVNAVLTEDSSHVEALKLRAAWLVDDDRPGEAILALRTAQSQAPRDPELMTLLAAAFERDGSLDLAGEQLAQAVVASEAGVAESLRYARFLANQDRIGVAETVLRDARAASGNNPQILGALARVLMAQENWSEVREIISLLESAEQPQFTEMARQIEAAMLLSRNEVEEGLNLLADQAAAADDDIRPIVSLVVTQIQAGQVAEARTTLDEALSASPDSPTLRLLSANLDALEGNAANAETTLRALIEENPGAELPVRLLYGVLVSQDKSDEAQAVLTAGIEAIPNARQLLWIQASRYEQQDQFDEAIEIYERIYAINSADTIAANNLASMLSVYRDDAESLERAHAIARRLRSLEVPAFQDTYGWIEYRRGNLEDALPFLQAGAAGLPNDPIAQFHLGMLYADLGRTEDAIAQFERMLELAEGRALPQIAVAQERLAALTAANQ